jgi:multidrug efflux pump subunit AcrA (membrane-fusion protein)
VVAAAAFTVIQLTSASGSHRAVNPNMTTTATVQRTNLAQTTPVNGTIGFASPVPGGPTPMSIVEPGGTPPSALTQAQLSVTSAQQSLAADQQAAVDATAAAAQSVVQAQQALSAAEATLSSDITQRDNDQAALAADQQKVASDQAAVSSAQGQLTSARQKAAQTSDQNQAKLNADQLNVANARSAALGAQTSETAYDRTSNYTALPAAGQVIAPGQPLWSVDGHPVVLLPGTLSPWRAFTPGLTPGPDVATLNQALTELGDGTGLTVSDTFTEATAVGIDRLQRSLGLPQTGTFPLGSVMFAPTALRVTAVHPQVGAPVTAGAPVLDVTSTTPIVNVALPVAQSYLVKVGDPVSVTLPDGTTTNGTISSVGTVATTTTPPPGSSSSSPSASINVTVAMPHPTAAAALDQAPVTVNITNGTATDVLAVVTTALLPLAGGGYAVEAVAADGTHHLVSVTTGIFDDQAGMVQVSGAGLVAGQKVVAAA